MERANPKLRPAPAGFTIVELLVVIGIITVLIAILLPVLSKVREQAKRTACMSNLRQWGAVLEMYAQTERRYPATCAEAGTFGGYLAGTYTELLADTRGAYGPVRYDMRDGLTSYVVDWRIAFCPSAELDINVNQIPTPLINGYIRGDYTAFYGFFGGTHLIKPGDYWTDSTGIQRTALMSDSFYSNDATTTMNHPGISAGEYEGDGPDYYKEVLVLSVIKPPTSSFGSTLFTDGSVVGRPGPSLVGINPVSQIPMAVFYLADE